MKKQCCFYYFNVSNPDIYIIDEIRCENKIEDEIYCNKHRLIEEDIDLKTPTINDNVISGFEKEDDIILSSDFHVHETHISDFKEFLSISSDSSSFYRKFSDSPRFPDFGVKFYIGESSFYLSGPQKVFLNYCGIFQEIEIIRFQLIAQSIIKDDIFKFKLVPILKDNITFPNLPHHIIVYNIMTDMISDDKESEYINFRHINSDFDLINLYAKTSGLNLIYDNKSLYGVSYIGYNFISNNKDESLGNIIKFNRWLFS